MQPERGCGAGGYGVALSGRWILLQALKSRHQATGLDWLPAHHCTPPLPQPRLLHFPPTLALQLGSVSLCPSLEHAVGAELCPWVSGQPNPHTAFISVLPVSHKGWLHPHVSNVEALGPLSTGVDGLASPTTGMQDASGSQLRMGGMAGAAWITQASSGLAACHCPWEHATCLPWCPQADTAGEAVCVCLL